MEGLNAALVDEDDDTVVMGREVDELPSCGASQSIAVKYRSERFRRGAACVKLTTSRVALRSRGGRRMQIGLPARRAAQVKPRLHNKFMLLVAEASVEASGWSVAAEVMSRQRSAQHCSMKRVPNGPA